MQPSPPRKLIRSLIDEHLREHYGGPAEMAELIAAALEEAACGAVRALAPGSEPPESPTDMARRYVSGQIDADMPVNVGEVSRLTGWDAPAVRRFIAALHDAAQSNRGGKPDRRTAVPAQRAASAERPPRRTWTLSEATRERMRQRALERHARERAQRGDPAP